MLSFCLFNGLLRRLFPAILIVCLALPALANKGTCEKTLKNKITNRFIDPRTGYSVYGKIAMWDLGSILSLIHKRSYISVHSFLDYSIKIGFVLGNELLPIGTDSHGRYIYDAEKGQRMLDAWDEAQEALVAQYPELAFIEVPTFTQKGPALEAEISQWLLPYKERFGRYLPVVQVDLLPEQFYH